MINEKELFDFVQNIGDELNTTVFLHVYEETMKRPEIKTTLNPAFPYPKNLRVGIMDNCLAVEYIGPEIENEDSVGITGIYKPGQDVFDFLEIDLTHMKNRAIPCTNSIYNMSFFLGDSIAYLCDYFYDITQMPSELILLNGYLDFSSVEKPICVSNTNFFWTDIDGRLKIKHIDFLEVFPQVEGGIGYHDEKSLQNFANFVTELKVPKYDIDLHRQLNDFIQLINIEDTNEYQITKFLDDNPGILQISFGAHALNPQKVLKWQYDTDKSDLKPDFLIEKMDGFVDILEFKLPKIKSSPIVGISERRQPSFEIDSAMAQVELYNEWCSQEINRRWAEAEYGLKIMSPNKFVVLGHSADFSAEDRQRLRKSRGTIIFTYDEFIEMARFQIYRVR